MKKLYQKFLEFQREKFLKISPSFFGVEKKYAKKRNLLDIFEQYEKDSFLTYLSKIKTLLYSKNPFDYLLRFSTDRYEFYCYLEFLIREKIILAKKEGRISILKKELLKEIPSPLSYKEIVKKVEKSLRTRLKLNAPANSIFKRESVLEFDQFPISISSAIFLVEKVLEYLPLYKKFLFIGDDDFVSVYLSLADPKVESLVIDVDDELLERIEEIAKKHRLRIETKKMDIVRGKKIDDYFVAALVNPPYNFEGARLFVNFATKNLSQDGGFLFLVLGDESIGNRLLLLENNFIEKGLFFVEVIKKRIFYPQGLASEEEKMIFKGLNKFFSKKFIQKNPMLAASLFIFEYSPFKIKPPQRQSIYTYL